MRKLFIYLFLLLVAGASAQEASMREAFKQMPDTLIPYLTANNRLDFIDFIDSKMNAEVANTLGGKSRMLQLTDRYAALSLNEASSIAMRLLPVAEPVDSACQIICLVRTYGKDVQESTVSFYSMKWRPLQASDYLPPIDDMVVATLNDETTTMTLTPVCKLDAPANEEQKEITKPSTNLKWEGEFVFER
jgi:hypothetical protein